VVDLKIRTVDKKEITDELSLTFSNLGLVGLVDLGLMGLMDLNI
jgi:hypothetical protein